MQVECVAGVQAQLGEGALWDAARGVIWWVDIRAATLHSHHVRSGINRSQTLPCRLTALGLTMGPQLLACGDRGYVRLSVAADLHVTITGVIGAPTERAGNRFNDGKVDSFGHFWAGTMDDEERGADGALYRLDPSGTIHTVRTGLCVPNGPCFLADGTVLTTDSPHRLITALQVDAQGMPVGAREFARFGATQGCPDGMTVDADNHVWVAFWDGGCIRRLSPGGEIVAEIALPVQRPTCPTFGGPDLRHLYVTTARTGLTQPVLAKQPWAGSLLRIDPGVRGLAPGRFRG